MSIILKNSKSKGSADKRQAYTWAACGLVGIFLISVAVPLMSSTGKKDLNNSYNEKYFDLADMPFATDAAEAALLASGQYNDIAKTDLINTLFSKKDKEERQAEDLALGVPPPPDEEYKEAAVKKERVQRAQAYAQKRATSSVARASVTPTSKGSLSTRSGASGVSGGSFGIQSNIWRGDDAKRGSTSGRNSGSSAGGKNANVNQADLMAALKKGRGAGFVDAYAKSDKAGKAKDVDSAAAGAASAFDGSKADQSETETELETEAQGLGIASMEGAENALTPNAPGLGNLDKKLSDKKRDNDKKLACNGAMLGQKIDLKCLGGMFLGNLVNNAAGAVGDWLKPSTYNVGNSKKEEDGEKGKGKKGEDE